MADTAPAEGEKGKTVVLVGVDDSEHSNYALEWTVRHLAAGMAGGAELVIVHAKPSPSSVVGFGAGPGSGEVVRYVEADLRKTAEDVVERARRLCIANAMHALIEVMEGEPRYVLCNAVDKHNAGLLVVGSHGYGAIKRAFLGSVSDYCAHHAHCSVMIVKQPKAKRAHAETQ
ncbi:hypothetical protein GUJ93_ZPchr0007g3129 [Zizania palustris]|uniref:UspA domain-containing protein n=1 Tax=Zizania palustris TaxID=103762 RepID=A0A8J5SSA1_ZIZPA|nr:hypothetical protein GUJ93_ZPchr0007g3129 [Zizania palustris]